MYRPARGPWLIRCLVVIVGCGLIAWGAGCRSLSKSSSGTKAANNQYCLDCHLNYAFDKLATKHAAEGIGCVEAPRGTLTHHYATDERGIVTKVNLIVGTTNNNAPICMSVKKAAQGLIKKGNVSEGLLNMVEMAFRAYDPCFGCATHNLPGEMPLEVRLRDPQGNLVERLTQNM